jgi:LuxR family transcriptional regulator, regulator of acetate metabolism
MSAHQTSADGPVLATTSPPESPVAGELHERLAEVVARASATLGVSPVAGDDLAIVRSLLAAVADRLEQAGLGAASAERHSAELARLEARFEQRGQALTRAHAAAIGLRRLTSPDALLAHAPAALCQGSGFARALLSMIRESAMVPLALHVEGDPEQEAALLSELRAEPLRLEHPLIETEVLRRRRATLVTSADVNPRVSPRLASLMGWRSYVAAPLLAGATVVGILHADRGRDETLGVLDRDALWEFSTTLSQLHESAGLRRSLRREREELTRFLDWLNARSVALADGPITLTAGAAPAAPGGAGRITSDRSKVFDPPGSGSGVLLEILTRRELDVLRLLAEGGTNRAIADTLVLSETTVKFHVNGILRKLHVANRAQAVARYLEILGSA